MRDIKKGMLVLDENFGLVDAGLSDDIWRQLQNEDMSQIAKWGFQKHGIFQWLAFITEELGELSEAISEYVYRDGDIDDIRKEAVQVATLAAKVAEMIGAKCVRR